MIGTAHGKAKQMKTASIAIIATACFAVMTAQAQEMPAPRRMPRTPVSRETLSSTKTAAPISRQVQGPATIIDGEKLKIGDTDLRLFGIVPPQLSASFGPQARAKLDSMVGGQSVSCQIRDRDRDGRLLATCRNSNGNDIALDLLKHGLAVTARGSLADTEFATPYAAAEQAAQTQKIGLWSVAVSAPAPVAKQEAAPAPTEAEAKKEEKKEDKKEEKQVAATEKNTDTATQAKITAEVLSERTPDQYEYAALPTSDKIGFFERYQIMISGLLMLATATGITAALWEQKNRERRDDVKALAAALRGELMAARSVCAGRAKNINTDQEDKAATWPRIRSTLYQACVGRIGLVGADMARQISSIYGQLHDYAALYGSAHPPETTSKKNALETLGRRIEEVLPKLEELERSGRLPSLHNTAQAPAANNETPAAPPPDAPAATQSSTTPRQPQQTVRATIALWETVRSFIQNHGSGSGAATPPMPPIDPQTAEYAAMIEADMARYQYGESVEPLDISPQKKRG